MKHYHPNKNDNGQLVELLHPTQPTGQAEWGNPTGLATITPRSAMPDAVGEIMIHSWTTAPRDPAGWERLAEMATFDEPPFKVKLGKKPASGTVVVEPDGRVWVISPSNRFGGYTNTFPKGTIYPQQNFSLRANALKETYEESGLQIELCGFLADSDRSETTTRYYLARRIGGNPANMGWETQAVHLIPRSQLAQFVSHQNDKVVLKALDVKTPGDQHVDIS